MQVVSFADNLPPTICGICVAPVLHLRSERGANL